MMTPSWIRLIGFAVGVVGAPACTDASLFRSAGGGEGPLDNKLSVQSSFCTLDPNELKFPVKILFVVDTSQSMGVTDPAGQRLTAVKDVVDAFLPDPGVEFGIISFNNNTNILTPSPYCRSGGFTRDRMRLYSAILQLGMSGGNTNYEGALNDVFEVLSCDMQHLQDTSAEDLARAKYVIVFVSDGLPYPVDRPRNTRDSILQHVGDVANLTRLFRPREIRFHTALLLSPSGSTGSRCTDDGLQGGDMFCPLAVSSMDCAMMNGCVWIGVEEETTSLLEAMADAGKGTFRSFANGEEINFLKIDFTTIRRIFTLKNLIVSDVDSRPRLLFTGPRDRIGSAPADTDGDGLDDEEEMKLGTNPRTIDTDGDGFNDLLEVRLVASGFDPLDPSDADCRLSLDRKDSDGDGLLDCEERFAGTNRNFFDSDADGIPDAIELRFDTNPTANDVLDDLDFDGARNGDEIRGHSDPRENDAANRSSIAYRYDVENIGLQKNGTSCYKFKVENITMSATSYTRTATAIGLNRVLIYIDEAPFDDPKDFGSFRVACVKQTFIPPDFRDPPYPAVEFPPEAFKKPTELDLERDCVTGSPPTSGSGGETP
jgi:VWA domain-containing protein/thrombospondin type 3 repeat protein